MGHPSYPPQHQPGYPPYYPEHSPYANPGVPPPAGAPAPPQHWGSVPHPGAPIPGGVPPQVPPRSSHAGYSWLMGLIVVFLIPVLSSLAAGIAMALYSRSEVRRAHDEIDRKNANRAGNWGITYAIGTVVLVGGHVVGLFIFNGQPILDGFWPYGSILMTWIVWSFVHVAVSIIGVVVARKGRLMPVNGIPFFR